MIFTITSQFNPKYLSTGIRIKTITKRTAPNNKTGKDSTAFVIQRTTISAPPLAAKFNIARENVIGGENVHKRAEAKLKFD